MLSGSGVFRIGCELGVEMEVRMKKYQQVSPERAKVWKSLRYCQNRKVPMVYYLCRNQQLEHPHFSLVANIKIQALKQLPGPKSSRNQDESLSSTMSGKEARHTQEDEQSSPLHPCNFLSFSPDSGSGRNSYWSGSLSLTQYKVYKNDGLADASTQTEENVSCVKTQETCERGISTDDGSLDNKSSQAYQNKASTVKEKSAVQSESVSPRLTPLGASSSCGRDETLESFIRADASKMNGYRILEEEEIRMPANASLKATKMLQLILCGSISVKDNNFGLILTYHPRFSPSRLPSPMFSTSMMLGELDCFSENPRLMGLRLEEEEYFSGSLIDTKTLLEDGDGLVALKRSSSFSADRSAPPLPLSASDHSITSSSKC